jgi:hypothetical protein
MVVVGGIFGVLGAFLKTYFYSASSSRTEREKLQELKDTFRSTWGIREILSREEAGSEKVR